MGHEEGKSPPKSVGEGTTQTVGRNRPVTGGGENLKYLNSRRGTKFHLPCEKHHFWQNIYQSLIDKTCVTSCKYNKFTTSIYMSSLGLGSLTDDSVGH